jgi:hypothetical protein
MRKLGIFNLIKEGKCRLKCNCGWNLFIGGEKYEDMLALKRWLKNYKNEIRKEKG